MENAERVREIDIRTLWRWADACRKEAFQFRVEGDALIARAVRAEWQSEEYAIKAARLEATQ